MGATLLAGCATIVEGTDQTVSVHTEPSGAECRLTRGGTLVGVINPTPGSVNVDKSRREISVSCEREGYRNAVGILDSDFQATTLGNLIIGGIIGVGVDAASGAMNEYDESIIIHMIPEDPFPAEAEREGGSDGAPMS
jgi:hypothetical protein